MIVFHQTSIESPDHQPLFFIEKFVLSDKERFGLIGPNGSGKTTFFKYCAQTPGTLAVAQKIPAEFLTSSWNDLVAQIESHFDYQKFYELLEEFGISPDLPLSSLSGGQQKIGFLGYTLFQSATHYLLDEPTNHLDIKGILWLEEMLKNASGSYLIISHDRAFLDKTVQGYWAIYDKKLRYYAGSFEDFLEKREHEEITAAQERSKKEIILAQEERYRERGVTARRKRNQKRVERLALMRKELASQDQGPARMSLDKTGGSKVHHQQRLIEIMDYKILGQDSNKKGFSATLSRIDRIALIGPNGCGKTTFLKVLLDPENSHIKFCRPLKIAYIDQQRRYDTEKTLVDHISQDPHQMTIETPQGEQRVHPAVYLQRFGFLPQDLTTPYGQLSGGQQMKMALALSLISAPDVLVLDEPTNDLDQESLEDLADWLEQYQGLVIFVSHDRYFIDQCATSSWYWTSEGLLAHAGGIDEGLLKKVFQKKQTPIATTVIQSPQKKVQSQHLQEKSARESAKIEKKIQENEAKLAVIIQALHQHYAQEALLSPEALAHHLQQQKTLESQIERLWAQWEESLN